MPSFESFYQEYLCSYNSPLNCDRPFQTAQQIKGAKFCLECGFPATLPHEAEIKGSQGTYQIGNYLGVRGFGRLYSGIQIKDKQPVIIKEYLLPNRSFNENETIKRKDSFKRVGGVSLADSRIQNFRLVETKEAIADDKGERCYLIAKVIDSSQTLSKYIIEKGAMTAPQVREVLNQGLQTIQFLHTQKLRFPSNQVQLGLTHGNINLDSTLIKLEGHQKFSIYFCDLAIWENLFIPPIIAQPTPARPEQDLQSLGMVAFYLWAGRTTNLSSNQPLDPRDNRQWPDTDNHLKQFIYRLMGLETPFESAEAARQVLLQLPKEDSANTSARSSAAQIIEKRLPMPLILLLGILALLLLGSGIWYFLWRNSTDPRNQFIEWSKLVRNFSEVPNVPSGEFTYTGEKDSTWSYILTQPVDNSRLADLLAKPKPDATATYNYESVLSANVNNPIKSIEEVQAGKKDFAITSLGNNITSQLAKTKVADDGLIVFVAFNKRDSNLANALGGQISLEQLRQIYTGKITNWQQINSKLPSTLKVKPFAPTEPEAIVKFEEIVLKNDPQDKALFAAKVTQLDTTKTQNQIRSEVLEGRATGIISFGIISKTWKQCTGYPLAIANYNKQVSQPLFQKRDRRPITPSDDLCQHDDYYVDVTTFQSYPLGYPVFVVYPQDSNRLPGGSTFAQMLITRQGQCLLSKVGLVALQPMPDYINSYACKSVP